MGSDVQLPWGSCVDEGKNSEKSQQLGRCATSNRDLTNEKKGFYTSKNKDLTRKNEQFHQE